MSTYRPRIIASLCLMLAVGTVAACAVLLRPEPADAAGNRQRQFVYGPVLLLSPQTLVFSSINPGPLPTPRLAVVFRDPLTQAELKTITFDSQAPGQGVFDLFEATGLHQSVAVVATFDRPAPGQAVPNPFPGTVQLLSSRATPQVLAVLHPHLVQR
jgi:hypothetical protein